MWGDLLVTNSLKQSLHVVELGEDEWAALLVVWVLVARPHLVEFVLIVGLAISGLILWLMTIS